MACRFYVHLGYLVKIVSTKHNVKQWRVEGEALALMRQAGFSFSLAMRGFFFFGLSVSPPAPNPFPSFWDTPLPSGPCKSSLLLGTLRRSGPLPLHELQMSTVCRKALMELPYQSSGRLAIHSLLPFNLLLVARYLHAN